MQSNTGGNRAGGGPGGRAEVNGLPRPILWLVTVLCGFIPCCVYTVIAFSSQVDPGIIMLSFILTLLFTWMAGSIGSQTRKSNHTYAVVLGAVVVMEGVLWALHANDGMAEWTYPLLMIFIGYRLASMTHTSSLTDHNKSSFYLEIGLTLLLLLLVWLSGASAPFRDVVLGSVFVGLVVRLYAMWVVERYVTQSVGARSQWPLLVVAGLLAVLFGPWLIYHLILAVVMGGGVIALPFLYLANLIMPHKALQKGWKQLSGQVKPPNNKPPQTHQPSVGPDLHWVLYVVYAAVVVLAAYLVWRQVRRSRHKTTEVPSGDVQIKRTWVRGGAGLHFVATNHPVRKRYQEWIADRHTEGITMKASETPREFEDRVRRFLTEQREKGSQDGRRKSVHSRPSGAACDEAHEIRQSYEEIRYTDPNKHNDSI